LQHIKPIRPGRAPLRRRSRRVGADAAFAKAMARSEFGRFYTDDQEQREVRRSLARGKARREADGRMLNSAKAKDDTSASAKVQGKTKPLHWREPSPRHRRSELAEARARLKEAARLRAESEDA
jgi:hypothetical protein